MIPLLLACALAAAAPPAVVARERGEHESSVYLLDGDFTDQHGRAVKLHVFRGKPVLLGMVYASCPSACPLLVTRVKRLLASLPERERGEVRVVLVSLDPARDTPEHMKKMADAHQLDGASWRLLRGDDEGMREVAAVLGVRFRDDGKGSISHSSGIALLDGAGVIVTSTEELDPAPESFRAKLLALARGI